MKNILKETELNIVKRDVVLTVTAVAQSLGKYKDDYFINTEQAGTSVHPGLVKNDRDAKFGGGGSWIVGDAFIETKARALGVTVKLFCSYCTPKMLTDQACELILDVEERIVGTRIVLEDGKTPKMDSRGNPIIYSGSGDITKEGEKYYAFINPRLIPSATVLVKAEEFIVKEALAQPRVDYRPTRRASFTGVPQPHDKPENFKEEIKTVL